METVAGKNTELPDFEKPFALAVAVIRDRLQMLSKEDRDDLYELLPVLFGRDDEERESAQRAVKEIFDQASGSIRKMDLSDAVPNKFAAFVGETIKGLRVQRDWTQEQLGEKSGLDQTHISKLESGQHSPSHKTLEKIAAAFGIPVGDLDPSF